MVYLKIISTTTQIEKSHITFTCIYSSQKIKRERVPSFISNGCIPNQMDTERKRYILLALSEMAL